MRILFLLLALPLSAYATCPQIVISGSETGSVNLSKNQAAHCSAEDVFICTTGSLRIAGRVDSVTKGTAQISAFCRSEKDDPVNSDAVNPPDAHASFNERFTGQEED